LSIISGYERGRVVLRGDAKWIATRPTLRGVSSAGWR
jgi:hypothetical protein